MDITRAVQSEYDKRAEKYDTKFQIFLRSSYDKILESMKLTRNDAVLDVGCGTGELLRLIAEKNKYKRLVGIDVSEKMIRIAKKKLEGFKNVEILYGHAHNIEFKDNEFSKIVSTNVIHHMASVNLFLEEMHRVLKKGGTLLLTDFCTDGRWVWFFEKLWRFKKGHQKAYSTNEMRKLFRVHEFKDVRISWWKANWFWSVMLVEAKK